VYPPTFSTRSNPRAVIAINDNRLLHAMRDTKVAPLPHEFWESLPDKVTEPDEIRLVDRNEKI